MATKIFVSYQQKDASTAAHVHDRLRTVHTMDAYLALIDPEITGTGDQLGDHIKTELGKCTHLLAVVSANTKESWWVPWEIGIATEKAFPISTYAGGHTILPEYLRKWPYLNNDAELDHYASAVKTAVIYKGLRKASTVLTETAATIEETEYFYKSIRERLGR